MVCGTDLYINLKKRFSSFSLIFKFLFTYFFIFFSLISCGYSLNVSITFDETVSVYDHRTDRYDLVAEGYFEITNPSSSNSIYEYGLDFNDNVIFDVQLGTYSIDVYDFGMIGRVILPGETIRVDYILRGKISDSIFEEFEKSGETLFEWYTSDLYFSPMRHASLNKLERQDSNSTTVSIRDVWIIGINPTDFNVKIDYLYLYKTDYTDYLDFRQTDNLLNSFKADLIEPKGNFKFMGRDYFSDDTSVYWLEYSIVTYFDLLSNVRIEYRERKVDYGDRDNEIEEFRVEKREKPLQITKYVSDWIVDVNDVFTMTLLIRNVNDVPLYDLVIEDYFIDVFKLVNSSDKFFFKKIDKINQYETIELEYSLNLSKQFLEEIFYFTPAKLSYDYANVEFSNSVSVVNDLDFVGKKLFVEKVITYEDENTIVTIKVKNIGTINLTDIHIIDSGVTDKNLNRSWVIKNLGVDDEWSISYEVVFGDELLYVPEVFGIINTKVYKTIIINSNVESAPISNNVSKISYFLGVIVIVLLVIDLLY
ncbi:MAG: hypothetical protein HRU03_06615 [Nanoarchaeales archaeon]|nr:hypothetical protein [Nanoarchaeales archaeon]